MEAVDLQSMNLRAATQTSYSLAANFDDDLLLEIAKLGAHPFMLLRVGAKDESARTFLACMTQNEAGLFVKRLAALPGFAESKLLRGIERALRLETYEAAEALFSWVFAPPADISETVYFGQPDNSLVHE